MGFTSVFVIPEPIISDNQFIGALNLHGAREEILEDNDE